MPLAHQYSKQEVSDLLIQSEGRNSPTSLQPGHTMALHIGQSGLQISDRLVGKVGGGAGTDNFPIIMGPTGSMLPENQSRPIWKGINPALNTQALKNVYNNEIDNSKNNSGAFLDLQQALVLARFTLNCGAGQTELAKLDAAANRATITTGLSAIQSLTDSWSMNCATTANDQTHIATFTKVFMIVDKIDADHLHLQTFYPIA